MFCYRSTAKTVTSTVPGVVTPTPIPNGASVKTTKTTFTTVIPGYTTTDSNGSASSVSPSTFVVVENVAITEPAASTVNAGSRISLHDFNVHGLWGVAMSLTIVTTTFVFMVLS